jgi:hypothetical protein
VAWLAEEIEREDGEDIEEVEPEDGSQEVEDLPEEYSVSVNGRPIQVSFSQDRYVRLESGGLKGYVEPRFVRAVQEAPQEGGRTYIKPAEPKQVLRSAYAVAGVVRFIGTSGFTAVATHENGRRVLEQRQYIRPIAPHASALFSLVRALKDLYASGTPVSLVMLVYVKDRVRVLPVKSITAYFKRYRTSAGVVAYPEVRFLFTKPIIAGVKKRTGYVCDLVIIYALPRAVRQTAGQARVRQARVEEGSAGVRAYRVRALPLGTTAVPPPEIRIVPTGQTQEGQAEGQEAVASIGKYVQPAGEGQPQGKYVQEIGQAITAYPRSLVAPGVWLDVEGYKFVKAEAKHVKRAD